jgi:hypothetical protein
MKKVYDDKGEQCFFEILEKRFEKSNALSENDFPKNVESAIFALRSICELIEMDTEGFPFIQKVKPKC